jgi:hypothetical protein
MATTNQTVHSYSRNGVELYSPCAMLVAPEAVKAKYPEKIDIEAIMQAENMRKLKAKFSRKNKGRGA